MKSLFITFISALVFLSAQGQSWAEGTILGKWERKVEVNQELTLYMKLDVSENRSTFNMTCDVNGTTGDVQISVATKIDGWKYHVLEQAVDAKDVDDFDCRLIMRPGVWDYDLMGDQLKLLTDTGDLLFLHRPK